MTRILAALLVLLLLPAACRGAAGSASPSLPDTDGGDKTVGVDIAFQDIMDFYYTYDASTDPPVYQRYRVYADGGKTLVLSRIPGRLRLAADGGGYRLIRRRRAA